jgi:thiazole/oxazole-forming peptide maturase SagC family component
MKKNYFRIKQHFSIIPYSSEQVELRSGIWNPTSFVLHDESDSNKLYPILKDINGHYAVSELARKHQVSSTEIEMILDQLQQLDVLESAASTGVNYCPQHLMSQFSNKVVPEVKNILIVGEEQIVDEIKRILVQSSSQIKIETINIYHPSMTDIRSNDQWLQDCVLMQDTIDKFSWWKDYFMILALTRNDPILAMGINQINFSLGVPWIQGVIDGPFLLIGPTFSAKTGPCYHCFEKRVSMNLREYASYQRYKEKSIISTFSSGSHSQGDPVMQLLAVHLAMETLNYNFSGVAFTKGKVLSMYLPTMEICFNEVLRLSGCPVCGAVPHRDDQQLYYDYQTLLEGPHD